MPKKSAWPTSWHSSLEFQDKTPFKLYLDLYKSQFLVDLTYFLYSLYNVLVIVQIKETPLKKMDFFVNLGQLLLVGVSALY